MTAGILVFAAHLALLLSRYPARFSGYGSQHDAVASVYDSVHVLGFRLSRFFGDGDGVQVIRDSLDSKAPRTVSQFCVGCVHGFLLFGSCIHRNAV